MSLALVSSSIKQLIVMIKITIKVYDQSSLMLVLKTPVHPGLMEVKGDS